MDLRFDDGAYEERALVWLEGEVRELLAELTRAGIDGSVARVAAGNYLFGLVSRLDGSEGSTAARVCFVEDETVLASVGMTLHEYVLGTVDVALGL